MFKPIPDWLLAHGPRCWLSAAQASKLRERRLSCGRVIIATYQGTPRLRCSRLCQARTSRQPRLLQLCVNPILSIVSVEGSCAMRLGSQSLSANHTCGQKPILSRATAPQRFHSAVSKPLNKHDARLCGVFERQWRVSAVQSKVSCLLLYQKCSTQLLFMSKLTGMSDLQESTVALVDRTAEAAEDVIDQLPSNSQLQSAANTVLEAVEEVVMPNHLAQKRLQRKQQKARSVVGIACRYKNGAATGA